MLIALSTAAGCLVAEPRVVGPAALVGTVVVGIAFGSAAVRLVALPCALVALVAAGLAAQAWSGLVAPSAQRYDGVVTLVTDPEIVPGGIRMEVKDADRHSQLFVPFHQARPVREAMAGERVAVTGWLVPVRGNPWLTRRHIASRITAESVGAPQPGHVVTRLANDIRRLVQRGADHLEGDDRALYLGLVLGDDRGQSDVLVDEFRDAGLTHLLVVSGQNVAFVLVVAAPLLGRLQLRSRLVATLAVIAFFALITRFEPSVLRATTMVGLTAITVTLGRPTSRLRVLAFSATVCLLLDPFLVMSVGFGLSLSACAGIIVLGPVLVEWIPGPAIVRDPLAVTLAAEIGVAPLLIAVFDGVPVASIPANLLAGAGAGFVMSWGMSVGLIAGLVPGALGAIAMVPAALAVSWIGGVAAWASGLPLGQVDGRSGVAGVAVVIAVIGGRRWSRARRAPSSGSASELPRADV